MGGRDAALVTPPEPSPMTSHTPGPAAQQIAGATSKSPFPHEHGTDGARKVPDSIQAAPVAKPSARETWITTPAQAGDVAGRIVQPADAAKTLQAVLYVHGGGWIPGNAGTPDRLVRDLPAGSAKRPEPAKSPPGEPAGFHPAAQLQPRR